MFQLLGTAPESKRLALADAGHIPPTNFIIRETLDWLDTYLGAVPHKVISAHTWSKRLIRANRS